MKKVRHATRLSRCGTRNAHNSTELDGGNGPRFVWDALAGSEYEIQVTAVPGLLYPGADANKSSRPQEGTTLHKDRIGYIYPGTALDDVDEILQVTFPHLLIESGGGIFLEVG